MSVKISRYSSTAEMTRAKKAEHDGSSHVYAYKSPQNEYYVGRSDRYIGARMHEHMSREDLPPGGTFMIKDSWKGLTAAESRGLEKEMVPPGKPSEWPELNKKGGG